MACNLQRKCYSMETNNEETVITMYGEIVETQPIDWWTGEPVAGEYIIQNDFLSDLNEAIENGAKSLVIRMNSLGGDASVSILIHNRLREAAQDGLKIECIVDGVAMSGGSLIMCAADKVKVNPSSLIMIHKCWSYYYGAYNADELRALATSQDAYDKAQCSIYERKTGMSETKILHMMGETTYMTGREAVEKGFADEVVEDAEPVNIAASANRSELLVKGRALHIARGTIIPDYIPTVSTENPVDINNNSSEEGGEIMATNLEELRAENAELAQRIESELRAEIEAENAQTVSSAVETERQRIRDIDEIAVLYDDTTVMNAKYGKPCTAQEMTFRAAQNAAKQGTAFMANAVEDTKASGVNNVPSATDDGDTKISNQAEADKRVHELFKKEDK